ncbi:hypothetical protein TWF281_003214 [Arthrobotrys megalospora]
MAPATTHFLPAPEIRKQFAGLSKDDENERLEAAKGINVALRNTTENRDETVKYCLTRLIKGLTSANDSSRIGFSLALVELLYSLLDPKDPLLTDLPPRSIVQLIVEHTEPSGGLSKQEERGFYFGRLFGLKALIETGLLFTKESDASSWQSVLTQLVVLAQKKPWLRESCCLVIRNAALTMESSQKELIKVTCDELEKSGLIKSSDGVGIWIALLQKHKAALGKLNIRFQKRSSPFEKAYLQTLAKLLKESEGKGEDGEKLVQKGSWNARLSWVWDAIFEFYTDEAPQKDIASFAEFWQAVVNDGLFSNGSSDERKFWGFLVFNKAISTFESKDAISTIFSPNLMKCFINQLSAPERYLHKAAQKSLRVIKSKAENSPSIASTLLTCLLSHNGSPNFELVTKTKVIEPLFSCADENGQLEIVRFFKSLILQPTAEDSKSIEKSRQWAADQLLSMIRSSKSSLKDSCVSEIIDIFVEYGHFNIKSSNLPSELTFSATTQATFRTRLASCLSELLQNPQFRDTVWPAKAVLLIKQKQEDATDEFATTVDESIEEETEKVFKIISKLDKRAPTLGSRGYAFALMYSLLLLQLFNGEPDAMDMLQDLHLVFEKIGKERKEGKEKKKDKHRHKRQKNEAEHDHDHDDEEEQDSLEILIELLLGFLAKPSVLAKKMSQTVFRSFADSLSASALESLLRPLVVDESQEGQRELFDIEDEDEVMDDADSSEDDDEEDSDVEVIDVEEDSADDDEDDGEDDDDDSESEDDDEDDDDEDDDEPLDEETRKLHAAIAEALGTSKNQDPDASASDSDESMDDDQMLLVDEQLSKIFKHRKTPNKRQQKASAKESVVNFKNRVLELLEIYVKADGKCDDKIRVIVPCLEAMRKTGNNAVRSHAHNVLKSLTQSSKKKSTKDKDEDSKDQELAFTDPEAAFEVLKQIHEESAQRQSQQSREHAASCSHCSLYISKVLVASDKSWIQRITELYFTETMVNWMTDGKSGTQPALFTDFVTWAGTIRKSLTAVPPPAPTGEKVEVSGKGSKGDKKRKRKNK